MPWLDNPYAGNFQTCLYNFAMGETCTRFSRVPEGRTQRPRGWLHTLVGSRTLTQTTFEKYLLYINEEVETDRYG